MKIVACYIRVSMVENDQAKQVLLNMVSNKKRTDSTMRMRAMRALGDACPGDQTVIDAMLRVIEQKGDVEDSWGAINALAAMGQQAKVAVPALRKLLVRKEETDIDPIVWAAIKAIGKIGPAAKPAVPDLLRLLKQAGPTPRILITRALGRIRAKEALPALQKLRASPDVELRQAVTIAIWQIENE